MVGYTPYYVSGGVYLNTPRLLIASVPRSLENGIEHEVESSKKYHRYDYLRSILESSNTNKISSLYLDLFEKAEL